jgi:D-sedoheptulose 7-phosphate isomerase
MEKIFKNYCKNIINQLSKLDLNKIIKLERILFEAWKNNNKVFFCGNGGSAGNANHIANDLFYVINKKKGINTESLASNPAIITCLANDEGYENIFVKQLETKANINDVLIAFSGSGNSKNIIKAIGIYKFILPQLLKKFPLGINGSKFTIIVWYNTSFAKFNKFLFANL